MKLDKILIFDCETINTKFIYDMGYIIAEKTECGLYAPILEKQYIIEQMYQNKVAWESDGYKKKRKKYISLMRGKKAKQTKFGHALRGLKADIKNYNVEGWGAYNVSFDTNAMKFMCDYFELNYPFEELNKFDIEGMANTIHATNDYQTMCANYGGITPAGFVSTNAENTYRFVSDDIEFIEEHTSLEDCKIELDILNKSLELGSTFEDRKKFVPSVITQTLKIITENKTYSFPYKQKRNTKKGIVLK